MRVSRRRKHEPRSSLAGHRSYAKNIHSGRKGHISGRNLAFPLDMVDWNNRGRWRGGAIPCAKDRHVANGLLAGNQGEAFGNKARNAPD